MGQEMVSEYIGLVSPPSLKGKLLQDIIEFEEDFYFNQSDFDVLDTFEYFAKNTNNEHLIPIFHNSKDGFFIYMKVVKEYYKKYSLHDLELIHQGIYY